MSERMNGVPLPLGLDVPSTTSSSAARSAGCEGLCYDCSQCVLHTCLLAPILRWDAHIKECHFQRSRVSHAHKCCPDTWSGKTKAACLPVLVLRGGYDCAGRCLRCPFLFLLRSSFFFHPCREIPTHSSRKASADAGGLPSGAPRYRT